MPQCLIFVCLFLAAGCAGAVDPQPQASSTAASTVKPTSKPESWVMSADSFGPITVDTTKSEALASGAYQVPPDSWRCPPQLDWHSQKYSVLMPGQGPGTADTDHDGKPDKYPVKELPDITLRQDKPGLEFIDAGPDTRTDRGIQRGSSLSELKAAYGDRLISSSRNDPTQGASSPLANYAVSGKRSSLHFLVSDDRVESIYIRRGTVRGPDDIIWGRDGYC